jgi:hypothetical protein
LYKVTFIMIQIPPSPPCCSCRGCRWVFGGPRTPAGGCGRMMARSRTCGLAPPGPWWPGQLEAAWSSSGPRRLWRSSVPTATSAGEPRGGSCRPDRGYRGPDEPG